ncbi:MAG: TerC family protein [Chitinophagaceae bacterium]|nr:TerC family protein [Chitinophagaceae bacterium]
MESLFTGENFVSLLTLSVLEIVLGIDNVIFVSILMGRLDKAKQIKARRVWMVAGIVVRSALLLALGWLIANGNKELFSILGKGFNLRSLIMLAGGFFLLYKTVKEIHDKLEGEDIDTSGLQKRAPASFNAVMGQIILIDMVFSFDSIITAVGMARRIEVMITAVIIAMIIMFIFSQRISDFIHKHPTLKMLALSFLVMIGVILLIEGWNAEKAHDLQLKNYVYFAMGFSFAVEMLNMWMRKKKGIPVQLHEPHIKKIVPNNDDMAN